MTAPIVHPWTRVPDLDSFRPKFLEYACDADEYARDGGPNTDGQLWQRVAEGKRRD